MIILQIQNLTKRYGALKVLNDLSMQTDAPVVGISGSNGSGKSTLLKCLAGLLKPDSGDILWSIGGNTCPPAELTGQIGLSAPYIELYEEMSVTENLSFLRSVKRAAPAAPPTPLSILLERFQASSFANSLYGDLSTGQRQRVKLAAACIHEPPILCLDEPGSNLDEDGRTLVRQTVEAFVDQQSMVLIASNQSDELDLCHKTIDLDLLLMA